MSQLQNPLFDEEKEFLERKKLEYERALRGDVDHLKDQSVKVGKVAAVGAGLAGSIWVITKVFSGKKRTHKRRVEDNYHRKTSEHSYPDNDSNYDSEEDVDYFTAGNGKRYKSKSYYRTAADSARAFMEHEPSSHEAAAPGAAHAVEAASAHAFDQNSALFDPEDFENDPFRALPYDDSRRLSTSHTFDDGAILRPAKRANSSSRLIGTILQNFLQSDTGKVLAGQIAAVTLALVTKKVSELFPAAKNSDLATSPGYAPAKTEGVGVPVASPDSPDASTHLQSL